ncbi:hypothetical protein [Streptomyces sp. NPDC056682]|uniref:hypothetical protein n=1 Tax=Streptomyces sp. NPDC056682 TaxID=3345909 RepID=UPI003687E851
MRDTDRYVATVGPLASDPDAHRLGAVGRFVHRFEWWIGDAVLVVAAVVLVTWNYPTTMVVVWTTVIVLVGFAVR